MAIQDPVAELEPRFSSAGATPTPWASARGRLGQAEVYWLATVRPDGRPHVTPLIAVWLDGALYFSTGCNTLHEGLDLVVEGDAERVGDEATLRRVAERYAAKYGWHYTVRDGALHGDGGNIALVYAVPPTRAFGFGKGEPFSQTRWRF